MTQTEMTPQEVAAYQANLQKKAQREEREKKRLKRLGLLLEKFTQLPWWVKYPALLLIFVVYSPPLVLNVLSAMHSTKNGKLRVYSYPTNVYTWPLISGGAIAALLLYFGAPLGIVSWGFMLLWTYVMITVGFDFKVGGWFGVIIAVALAIVGLGWLGSAKDIPIFSTIGDFLSGWLIFPTLWIVTQSVILWIIYVLMMTMRRFNKRLRINGNLVIIDTLFGRVDRNTRASYSLNTEVPDVNELVIGLSTAFILEGKGSVKTHSFKNVPGGPLVTKVIEEMLAATAIENEDDLNGNDGGDEDDDGEL